MPFDGRQHDSANGLVYSELGPTTTHISLAVTARARGFQVTVFIDVFSCVLRTPASLSPGCLNEERDSRQARQGCQTVRHGGGLRDTSARAKAPRRFHEMPDVEQVLRRSSMFPPPTIQTRHSGSRIPPWLYPDFHCHLRHRRQVAVSRQAALWAHHLVLGSHGVQGRLCLLAEGTVGLGEHDDRVRRDRVLDEATGSTKPGRTGHHERNDPLTGRRVVTHERQEDYKRVSRSLDYASRPPKTSIPPERGHSRWQGWCVLCVTGRAIPRRWWRGDVAPRPSNRRHRRELLSSLTRSTHGLASGRTHFASIWWIESRLHCSDQWANIISSMPAESFVGLARWTVDDCVISKAWILVPLESTRVPDPPIHVRRRNLPTVPYAICRVEHGAYGFGANNRHVTLTQVS